MKRIPDLDSWAVATATDLRKVAEQVAVAPVPDYLGEERLRFTTIAEDAAAAVARLTMPGRIDRDRCIYVLTLDERADADALKSAYNDAKLRSDLKLPQDNNAASNVLYVGSSCATKKRKATLKTRLSHHLGRAPKGTYALSLAEWTSQLTGGIILQAWQYPSFGEGPAGDDAARRVVLAVEDWLSNELEPILGRRGSRH